MSEKRNDQKTHVADSRIGVVGDHVRIEGGIHFHQHADAPAGSSNVSEPNREKLTAGEQSQLEAAQPDVDKKRPKVFISYAREDQAQAQRLYSDLKRAGAIPWLDLEDLLPGQRWRPTIRKALKESDYVVVMLSSRSISKRGFVQAELKKALEILEEIPASDIFLIPVRLDDCEVTDEALLDLNFVDLFPDWERGLARILKVVLADTWEGPVGAPSPPEPRARLTPADLLQPGGALDVESRFYIERQADADVLEGVRRHRGLVTLQGPRQAGKTSMMLRLYASASQPGSRLRPVNVDFQGLPRKRFEDLSAIWSTILSELDIQLKIGTFDEQAWNPRTNYDHNVTTFLERFVFANDDTPLLICLDEVDKVFSTPIRYDFFPSVRAFFNRGAYDPTWRNLRWLLSTSSEPRFFIEDLNQSPFNVGARVKLEAFTFEETAQFIQCFGLSHDADLTHRVMTYVGGRPYLVHLLLYHLALSPGREAALFDAGSAGDGVFKEHLDQYVAKFQEQPELAAAMKGVIAVRGCKDVRLADRLTSAGLVREDAEGKLICACELYAAYLGGRL